MKTVLHYLRPRLGIMSVGLLIKFFGTVAELLLPWMLSVILDEAVPAGALGGILFWGGLMVLCAAAALGGNVIANRLACSTSRDVTRRLRHDLFARVMQLSCAQEDAFTTPSLISRLTSDTYNVHQMVDRMQRLGVRAPILLVGGIALTLSLEPVLTLVLIATLPLLGLVVWFVSTRGIRLYTRTQLALDALVRRAQESMAGIRVIHALSKGDYERARFDEANARAVNCDQRAGFLMNVTNPAMNLLLNTGLTVVIVLGAYRVNAGLAQPGSIIAFLSYFTIILNALMMVSRLFVMYSKGAASGRRIAEVLAAPADLAPQNIPSVQEDAFLRFDHVSFSYDKVKDTLSDVSFSLKRGQTLGIIGPTGSVSSFVLYSRKFSGPINEFANIISELQSALAAAERVFQLLDEAEEAPDAPGARELSGVRGAVALRGVRFGYGGAPVLDGFTLAAQPGQVVAIVGPTGAGKTTVINLLMRFYDADSGSITVDGQEILSLTRASLRRAYSMVLQDTWLFSGTVYENLAYGKEGVTLEQVRAAARAAKIDRFIEALPQGYDTVLRDGGNSISKGQRQLLTIARAMLLDAPMLILDEATSNVDTRTERRIQAAMLRLMEGRTCFVIAHRLSTIRNADVIAVLREGTVAECGTHDELMRRGGYYSELYRAQFDAAQDAG